MCTVSMTFDYGRTVPFNSWSNLSLVQTTTPAPVPRTALDIFEELVQKSIELDNALGLPNCEDPAKMKWLDAVRSAVRKHELAKLDARLRGEP